MQPVLAQPRTGLSANVVQGLIQDAPALIVGRGLEVVDRDLNVVDVVDELQDGQVRRNSYATLHATATLAVARELDWGAGLVRPLLTLSDGVNRAAFRLGVFWLPTPVRDLSRSPSTYVIDCVDHLDGLTGRVGESYGLPTGQNVLDAVTDILALCGYTQLVVDYSAADEVVPSPGFTRPITDDPTWLGIVNDLLAMIGYAGVWSDWDGRLRVQPYLRPVERAPEWFYDTGPGTSMVHTSRVVEDDYYGAPNQWTFYRNNLEEGVQPQPGNGLYRFTNTSVGRSSVEARGRVVPAPSAGVDVAGQAALEAHAQATIDADMALTRTIRVNTDLNPLHWHFDRVFIDDPDLGPPLQALCTEWTLPLKGRVMQQAWTELA